MNQFGRYYWLRGFVDIVKDPHTLGMRGNHEPLKTLVFAGMLETAATLFVGWLHRTSPALIQENISMMKPWMPQNQKNVSIPGFTEFHFNQAFVSTLATSFASIFAFGAVLWVIHWLLTKESRKLYDIAGMGAYASGIYALGTCITGIIEYVTGSLQFAPHAGILLFPPDHPFLFAVLSRINVFWIASYTCAAYAIVGMSFVEKKYGRFASAGVILIIIAWYALFSSFGAMLAH